MPALIKQRIFFAIAVPALIFLVCTFITFSAAFQQHPNELTLAILIDMLFLAPLLYYILIYKTAIAKATVLRVFVIGAFLATVILSGNNSPAVAIIKTFILPIAEILLISYVVYSLYSLKKQFNKVNSEASDFLTQSRAVLTTLMGSVRIANIMAAEMAVFYYVFSRKVSTVDYTTSFTCYKENGIRLILHTFLALFFIEAAGMHFLLQLWSETAAWILTGLSLYSCLQLYAHSSSLKKRPIIITGNELHLRNGILGGETTLQLLNIDKIVLTSKNLSEPDVIKLALLKDLEKHNVAVYLKEPVTVIKAFGLKKTGKVLLVSIDKPQDFVVALNRKTED
jgi:hypothetical protein